MTFSTSVFLKEAMAESSKPQSHHSYGTLEQQQQDANDYDDSRQITDLEAQQQHSRSSSLSTHWEAQQYDSSSSSLSTDMSDGLRAEVQQEAASELLYHTSIALLAWLYVLCAIAATVYLIVHTWRSGSGSG